VTFIDSRTPSTIGVLDPANGALERWTAPSAPAGIDLATFGSQAIVRWPSFDGREISGLLSLPPARFTGPRPVLVEIHGGPEEQARFGFLGRTNYVLEELGVAIVRPNVRGSAGHGKTFLSLDDGIKREDSVKDVGALLDWIARQPGLDASRVLVSGGSYGGYMSLAVATHYADRIAGAIDVVGISNFVSFLENTESYRRDLRRVEYGDERDPAMREFMLRTAPLNNAEKITRPLFVVQGRNDPRVPYTEAEQIVSRVRRNGTPVWYLRAENEGHGFARKENADYQFYAQVMFMRWTLLGERASAP
jgi:dipeptidyl aminopeptidase/acylaminoacyl peptidase